MQSKRSVVCDTLYLTFSQLKSHVCQVHLYKCIQKPTWIGDAGIPLYKCIPCAFTLIYKL